MEGGTNPPSGSSHEMGHEALDRPLVVSAQGGHMRTVYRTSLTVSAVIAFALVPLDASSDSVSFLSVHSTVTNLASTVPGNGDVNPYGVAVVPQSVGQLTQGSVLVSNFNNSENLQGTGTTIVQITPDGTQSLFAQLNAATLPGPCPGGVGLTTALVVLRPGWVIVGSLPTSDGTSATAEAGCLIIIDSTGVPVATVTGHSINGPWDMTASEEEGRATLFLANVLNGTVAASPNVVNRGTVVRIPLDLPKHGKGMPKVGPIAVIGPSRVIGSGLSERTDPAALVIGPTGVALSGSGTLYVADSVNNRIGAIPAAPGRQTTALAGSDVSANGNLNDPLGMALAPNGDILTANGNDGNIVETTPDGQQVGSILVDDTGGTGGGCLFGLALVPDGSGVYFVDDCDNTLKLLH
jgi:hypothetical protein